MFWQNILVGFLSFMCFGLCHPLTIKMEYYFGRKSWLWLFIPAIILIFVSLFSESQLWSMCFGISGFSLLWSSIEIIKQHKRVLLGRAKKNPNRTYEY